MEGNHIPERDIRRTVQEGKCKRDSDTESLAAPQSSSSEFARSSVSCRDSKVAEEDSIGSKSINSFDITRSNLRGLFIVPLVAFSRIVWRKFQRVLLVVLGVEPNISM